MTSISSLSDMHEDICTTAEGKRAAIRILPFHKHQRLDGFLETTRSDFRGVNMRVLMHAMCSVGIFVDRGLGGTTHITASNVSYSVTVLFFGGRDDREALAYGARMAEHPGIRLTILRFIVRLESLREIVPVETNDDLAAKLVSQDDEFLTDFKESQSKNCSITYEEKYVRNVAETVGIIGKHNRCNLFLVGPSPEGELALAMNGNGESSELGPVGCLLTSSEFSTTASVLVIQQYYENLSTDSVDLLDRDSDPI